jgi:hypothetical protein
VAFTTVAAVALLVAVLLLLTGNPKVSLVASGPRSHIKLVPAAPFVPPGPGARQVVRASAAAPIEWILLFLAIVALGFAAWLWSGRGRPRQPGVQT